MRPDQAGRLPDSVLASRPLPSAALLHCGLVLPLSLLLVACSDSNDDDGEVSEGQYLIGAVLCFDNVDPVPVGPVSADVEDEDTGQEPEGSSTPPFNDSLSCEDSPSIDLASSNLPPAGSGILLFDGQEYELNSAIRLPYLDPEKGSVDELLLHDGETRVLRRSNDRVERVDYGVYDGGLALSFTLLSVGPGSDPSGRVYSVMPEAEAFDERGIAISDVAVDPLLAVDMDGDGAISSLAEIVEPTSGEVVWGGTALAPLLTFTFVLEDGRLIEGAYEGGYERIELTRSFL